jgi:hypothetical protein
MLVCASCSLMGFADADDRYRTVVEYTMTSNTLCIDLIIPPPLLKATEIDTRAILVHHITCHK